MTDAIDWIPRAICQTSDKKVYLLLYNGNEIQLAELNSDTGDVTVLDEIELDPAGKFLGGTYLGAGVNGPAVCRYLDIREADIETGELTDILLFNGTSYSVYGSGSYGNLENINDFRVEEEGRVEVLKTNDYGNPAYIERLSLETVQRIPVVLCAPVASNWLKHQIVRFNQESDTYCIVVEELGESDGTRKEEYADAMENYIRQISIQIATGKGPDILAGEDLLGENVLDMIEKGNKSLEEVTAIIQNRAELVLKERQ